MLAADTSDEFLPLVDGYCQDEIGPAYISVVWRLWPHHAERFARYHARYFAEQPWHKWAQSAVIQVFVNKPKALAAVRDALLETKPDEWNRVRCAVLALCTPAPSCCAGGRQGSNE